jgi:flagellar biosynthesis protein FliP
MSNGFRSMTIYPENVILIRMIKTPTNCAILGFTMILTFYIKTSYSDTTYLHMQGHLRQNKLETKEYNVIEK